MTTFKLVLALVVGFIAGSLANLTFVSLGTNLIPLPAGIDPQDMESYKAGAHLLTAKHFIFPFLAHAIGTFVGAWFALWIAPGNRTWPATVIGVLFLLGGIAAAFMIPAPATFIVLDLALAYMPMAWLAVKVTERLRARRAHVG